MKYTFLFNQAGIFDAGLTNKTDFNDWAIMEYISEWQTYGGACKINEHVWLNYAHLLEELPMLSVKSKGGLSNRVKKLKGLGLLVSFQSDDMRLFVKVTDFYGSIAMFRPGLSTIEQGVPENEQGVPENEQGVPENEQGVPENERGVPENEHTINNTIINNQNNTTKQIREVCEEIEKKKTAFADDLIFKLPMEWAQFFISECGYPLHIVQTAKTIPLFADFVADRVTVGLMREAMAACFAWNHERIPDSPVLYAKFLRTIQGEHKRVSEDKAFANREGGGRSRAIVEDWAKVPRGDDDLWPWATKHGYSGPGTKSYREYRNFLYAQVERRKDAESKG